MTCRDILDFLMDYLDHGLTPAERALFEEHLAACPDCVNYMKTYEMTVRLGRAQATNRRDSLPPPPEDLVQAILAARKVEKA